MRVADYIAQRIEQEGTDTVFLLSGGGMMHLLDAVAHQPGLRYVAHHHEQAAAMAADAYARRSGRLGVCYATSGPGATNILTGVVGAWQDSSPVLFVTGQSKVSQTIARAGVPGLRQFGTFEVDIVPIVASVTKYAAVLDDPARVRYHVERALHEARCGRPGPVLLDVPIDVQGAQIEPAELAGFTPPHHAADVPEAAVRRVLEQLAGAERPLLLAGHGIRAAGAVEPFRALVDALGIPVVTTQLANDVLPYDHPLYVGHPGGKGDRAGNFAIQQADVLLSLGASLHVLTTGYEIGQFAPGAAIVLVDPDPAVHARQEVQVQTGLQVPVPDFVGAAQAVLGGDALARRHSEWDERCAAWKKTLAVIDEPHTRPADLVSIYDLVHVLSECTADDATVVTDAGSAFYVVGQAYRTRPGQRVIVSGSLGSMGFALPGSTGASLAAPGRQVVCVTGDGSLQSNVHELATIAHNNLPVKIFVLNNDGYISIRATQRNYFGGHEAGVDRDSGVGLPDLAGLAQAYGVAHELVSDPATLRTRVAAVLSRPGPVLCEVLVAEGDIIPTVSSSRLPDGRMQSRALDDMAPFMGEQERARHLGGVAATDGPAGS